MNELSIMRKRSLLITFKFLVVVGTFSFYCGCASTTTGIKTALDPIFLSQIKKIGIKVEIKEKFSVILNQLGTQDAGFIAGGLLGAAIQKGIQKGVDSNLTNDLKPMLGDFDCKRILTSMMVQGLQRSGRFDSVIDISEHPEDASSVDGLLILDIVTWGLRPGMSKDPADKGMAAYSAANRPAIPIEIGHPLRFKSAT